MNRKQQMEVFWRCRSHGNSLHGSAALGGKDILCGWTHEVYQIKRFSSTKRRFLLNRGRLSRLSLCLKLPERDSRTIHGPCLMWFIFLNRQLWLTWSPSVVPSASASASAGGLMLRLDFCLPPLSRLLIKRSAVGTGDNWHHRELYPWMVWFMLELD